MWAPVPGFRVCRSPSLQPARRFTLIDSNGKKIRFVSHAARLLGLSNVEPLQARAEEFAPDLALRYCGGARLCTAAAASDPSLALPALQLECSR